MYCNTTTDLRDVFPQVGNYQGKKLIERFVSVSGNANTYMADGVGYVEEVFDDGVQLTVQTSIANVQSNAGSYYYIADTDLLYVHAFGSDDLTAASIPDIEVGVDWDDFKTRMLNDAEEEMNTYFSKLFSIPLNPRLIKLHSSNDYESPVRLSCAYLTCRNIVRRLAPDDMIARSLEKVALNSNPVEGEELGLIDKILKGEIYLQDQIAPGDVGSVSNMEEGASNSGTGYVRFVSGSKYTGSEHQRWRLKMDTAGAPGTATWKLSYDTGSNYDVTLQETFNVNNNQRRINIGSGLEVVFWGTFTTNDQWDFDVYPQTDLIDRPQITSTLLVRG
jgi:hypothetical protein